LLVQLLSNLAAGGVTGYITNSLAIKMLFKKYPIIGGGVLVDNFDEFVENISLLVERDLINHATLEEEFQTGHFKQALRESMEHLLKHSLFSTFDNDPLKEIDGFNETLAALFDFLEPYEEELFGSLLREISTHIELDELLPDTQVERLADTLFTELLTIIKTELPGIITNLKASSLSVESLLLKELNNLFQTQLEANLSLLLESVSQQRQRLETLLGTLFQRLQTDTLLRQLTEQLFNKSFEEIVGSEAKTRFSANLVERFILMLEHDPEQRQLNRLSAALIDALGTVEHPLTHYMSEETKNKIIMLIQTYLPQVLSLITRWIDDNEEALERLIERLIDTTLTQGGVLGKIKLTFKTLFIGRITERFRILDRITGMMHDEQARDQHLKKAVDLVLEAISKRNINDVVQELVERHWLSPELIAKLIHFNLRHVAPLIEKIMLDDLLSRPLSSLFTADWQETLFTLTDQKLQPEVLAAQLALPSSRQRLSQWGANTLTLFTKRPIASMMGENVSAQLLHYLETNNTTMQTLFYERLHAYIGSGSLAKVLDEKTLSLVEPLLIQRIAQEKPRWRDQIASLPLHQLFHALGDHPKNADTLTNIVVMGLNDNLHYLLEENVSHTVKNELLKMGPSLLQERVEDFMGKELGPITWLGAGIGTGVGGALYATQSIFGSIAAPYVYGLIPAVYGATGILTNYLALKMLFRPHKQYRLLGVPIPFTPGIVGKRQPFFAKNMSEFVDETLLTNSAIHEKLISFKPELSASIKSFVTRDDYQMINDFLHDHGVFLTQQLLKQGMEQLPQRLDCKQMSIKAIHMLNSFDLHSLQEESTRQSIAVMVRERVTTQMGISAQNWFDASSHKPLREALPNLMITLIDSFISPVTEYLADKMVETLASQEAFEVLAIKITDPMLEQLRQEKLAALIPQSIQALLGERIVSYVLTHIQNPSTLHKLTAYLQALIVDETFQGDGKIGELFNGALTQTIEENLRMLFDHGFDEILHHIQADKPLILKEVKTLIKSQNSFVTNRLIKLAGVYGDVDRFITIFVDVELPRFLDERHSEIETHVHTFFDKVKEKELQEFAISGELFNLHAFEPMLAQLIQYPAVAESITAIGEAMILTLFDSTLDEQLQVFQWQNTKQILHHFTDETTLIRTHLQQHLADHQEELVRAAGKFTQEVWYAFSSAQSLKALFPSLDSTMLKKQITHTLEALFDSPLYNTVQNQLMDALVERFEQKGINGFVDEAALQHSIQNLLSSLLANDTLLQKIKTDLEPIVTELIMALNSLSDDALKQYLLNNGFEAAYDTLLANFERLVNAINFKGVIEREINKMHPKELEDMLNSFAKVYFNRLIFYGAYGALFGIPVAFTY